MKKMLTALASVACLSFSASAHADIYKISFTAMDIMSNDDINTLQAPVSGSIVFTTFLSPYESPLINDIDLTIAGHAYTLDEVAAENRSGGYAFGGKVSSLWNITSGTDDFYLFVRGRDEGFGYTVSGVAGAWTTRTVHSEEDLIASVPEPGSLALLLAGIGGLTTMRYRRRR
jgi:hypothetical protein